MSNPLKKKEVMKRLGISLESFDFYVQMKKITHIGRGKYIYDEDLEHQILEKSTVFKYSFSDSFIEDSREFLEQVKHTGKIKRFTKEEIKELEEKMRKEGKLDASKKTSK